MTMAEIKEVYTSFAAKICHGTPRRRVKNIKTNLRYTRF
jgi:hypothetical protein